MSDDSGVADLIRDWLGTADITYDERRPGTFVVQLPGEHKLMTACTLRVGTHSLGVQAFVIRRPDENAAAVHRWLLERNARFYGVAFTLDALGDVYLTGRLALHAVTPAELDRVLGSVLEAADGSFDTLLELGFASAIRREWAWRTSRGESTANLAAFTHLLDAAEAPADPPADAPAEVADSPDGPSTNGG